MVNNVIVDGTRLEGCQWWGGEDESGGGCD